MTTSRAIRRARSGDIKFTLAYHGASSEAHMIDMYDVTQALIGFQRSIALTTHLVLNDEIITQSPSLKGAAIYAVPPEEGSWKVTAVVATTLFSIATAQSNSPLGHVLFSLYDWVIAESLGFHVDYNKSLGQQYEEMKQKRVPLPQIRESQADSLMEKVQRAIIEMHRPIIKTETATQCTITGEFGGRQYPLRATLDANTFAFIYETVVSPEPMVFEGRVSSYNSNTFKGRIYIEEFARPVSFELDPQARSTSVVQLITTSLFHHALRQHDAPGSTVHILADMNTSRSGTLKSLTIRKASANRL